MVVFAVVALLLVLLSVGVSIAVSLLAAGLVGVIILRSPAVALSVSGGSSYSSVASVTLAVVPMFVLMGIFVLHSGIAAHIFNLMARILKWLPGGLAVATVLAAAMFGAVSGSSLATVATLAPTTIAEMERHGYQRKFAAGTVAVAGTLAVMIPPSILLILYGIMTGESVGRLLVAGIVPGILTVCAMSALIIFRATANPALVGRTKKTRQSARAARPVRRHLGAAGVGHTAKDGADTTVSDPSRTDLALTPGPGEPARVGNAVVASRNPSAEFLSLLAVALLFLIVIGGIYSGVFTPTESAAIGAVFALVVLVVKVKANPRRVWQLLCASMKDSVATNGMIFFIIIGASVFSFFLVTANVPSNLASWVVSLPVSPEVIVILILAALIPLGMFLESVSLLIITVPIAYESITALGFNGIWLGILMVELIELGVITPPVGMNVFVTAGSVKGLSAEEVFRGSFPYYLTDLIVVVITFLSPSLILWLPNLMIS